MSAGKVRHWKHGWIPVSPEAKAYAAGRGPKPTTTTMDPQKALERAIQRQKEWRAAHPEGSGDVDSRQEGDLRVTTVKGFPEVQFREVLELDRRPDEQYKEVAQIVHDTLKPYPRAAATPVTIAFSNELMPTTMADTSNYKPHNIRLNVDMWDRTGLTKVGMDQMRTDKFGLTAVAVPTDEPSDDQLSDFRANVIIHELGHELHMRDLDETEHVGVSKMDDPRWAAIEHFSTEPVTLRQLGDTHEDLYDIDAEHERWEVDDLKHQSAYALTGNFEFFAEAFLDGTVNGSMATESGKRAVQIAKQQFGPGSPTVRERLGEQS